MSNRKPPRRLPRPFTKPGAKISEMPIMISIAPATVAGQFWLSSIDPTDGFQHAMSKPVLEHGVDLIVAHLAHGHPYVIDRTTAPRCHNPVMQHSECSCCPTECLDKERP